MLDFRVWCIWLGGVDMTAKRKHCLETIQKNIGVPVTVITDANIHEYILKDHPLHEGYKYLSGVTQCDYIRAYIMNFYGGGYTDIKQTTESWLPYFTDLNANSEKLLCGYKEIGANGVAHVESDELYKLLQTNWEKLIGLGAFICKPHSLFTEEWFANLHLTMYKLLPKLKENPAKHPRDALDHWINGSYSKFPVRWTQLLGCIFHPLCLNYSDYLLNTLPLPIFNEYN